MAVGENRERSLGLRLWLHDYVGRRKVCLGPGRVISLHDKAQMRTPTVTEHLHRTRVEGHRDGHACAVASSHMDANECCRAHPCTRAIGEDFQMTST